MKAERTRLLILAASILCILVSIVVFFMAHIKPWSLIKVRNPDRIGAEVVRRLEVLARSHMRPEQFPEEYRVVAICRDSNQTIRAVMVNHPDSARFNWFRFAVTGDTWMVVEDGSGIH